MMNPQTTATNPPLNPSFYKLDDQEARFLKLMTGIQDDAELKEHILRVQAKAYSVYEYPCIRRFAFLNLKISRMPAYERVLKMGQERPGAILLDMGCCFGNDARKAVADGWPIQNVVASDLRQVFWDAGHELFRTTPEAFPLKFVPGDVFDSAHVAPREPFYELPSTPVPDLQSLTSLTLLQGHVSAIHASSFVHLFTQEQQTLVCKVLASLLSPDPGSTIFGSHVGLPKNGIRARPMTGGDMDMFCHDPNSYKELWHQIFGKGGINVEVQAMVMKHSVFDVWLKATEYAGTVVPRVSLCRLRPCGQNDVKHRTPAAVGRQLLIREYTDLGIASVIYQRSEQLPRYYLSCTVSEAVLCSLQKGCVRMAANVRPGVRSKTGM